MRQWIRKIAIRLAIVIGVGAVIAIVIAAPILLGYLVVVIWMSLYR